MKNLTKMPVLRATNAMEQLWKESFGSDPFEHSMTAEKFLDHLFDEFLPAKSFPVNISETDTEIKVIAEMPGVKKDDISVDYQDGVLTLQAEKKNVLEKDSDEELNEYTLRQETVYGMMKRSFNVGDIDPDDIAAAFTDGVLKITLQKKDVNFKKIEIQ